MQIQNAFAEFLLRRFVRANRIAAVVPPRAPRLPAYKRRWSGSTLKTSSRFRIVIATTLAMLALPVLAAVREVASIGLTVDNLGRELNFFTNTLPFEVVSITAASGKEQNALLGLNGVRLRIATLKLGDENITLTEHLGKKGRPIPRDSRSFDHWFQHIAIVVSDMDKAYDRLRKHEVKHVSTAPQTLPDWNKNASGIKAFYFRDPEEHVLEIIWFPAGKGDPKWQRSRRGDEAEESAKESASSGESASSRRRLRDLFLGIDHTAIVVSDTERSLGFYCDLLGLRVAGESENYGVEQEHLNQVFGARLRITSLRAAQGPGIEFLEYITPPGGRPIPDDANASDLVFWLTLLKVEDLTESSAALNRSGARAVSEPGIRQARIFRDPDGHALQLNDSRTSATTTAAAK
jgi:catechol 2,3-dioxygenase-like lactoylglutathione lyase family enzyme